MADTPATPDEWMAIPVAAPSTPPRFAHDPGPLPGPCPECGATDWRCTQVTSFGTAWQCCRCQTELAPVLALTEEQIKAQNTALLASPHANIRGFP